MKGPDLPVRGFRGRPGTSESPVRVSRPHSGPQTLMVPRRPSLRCTAACCRTWVCCRAKTITSVTARAHRGPGHGRGAAVARPGHRLARRPSRCDLGDRRRDDARGLRRQFGCPRQVARLTLPIYNDPTHVGAAGGLLSIAHGHRHTRRVPRPASTGLPDVPIIVPSEQKVSATTGPAP